VAGLLGRPRAQLTIEMTGTDEEPQSFECPRCGGPVQERFWGPCRSCRSELVAAHSGEPGDGASGEPAASRFEPAMHVVPNHVATKD
jgi:hypothetical protein